MPGFQTPLLFLNVSWMSKYQGLGNDKISGGFSYVKLHGYGHEILNFKPYEGHMYGFARVPHDSIRKAGCTPRRNFDRRSAGSVGC